VRPDGLIAACDSGRNGILLINPTTGIVTTNTGFNGQGDYTGVNNIGATPATAKFCQPYGVAAAGDGSLIVTDHGNHRVKVVNSSGITTNLYGVASNYWGGTYPGWYDGTVYVPDSIAPNVQSRLPTGVAFASDGTVYTTEDYYHIIRKVTGAGLPQPPPPPPQVPAPEIGWVAYQEDSFGYFRSVLQVGSSFVFNNDVIIAIKGTAGSQTYFDYGVTPAVGSIPDPTPSNSTTPPDYQDGWFPDQVNPTAVPMMPDVTIKAIGEKTDGSPNSPIVQSRFQFVTANPLIFGDNAALFTINDITTNAVFWYTIDGSEPTNAPPSLLLCTNSLSLTNLISLNTSSNFTFTVRAFRNNYQPSGAVPQVFSTSNFVPNSITFGFASGEASSDFVASPGQAFYAPVTLSPLPNTEIYSLQFNLTVTNGGPNPGPAITPGAFSFESMLMKPDTNTGYYLTIPPYMFIGWYTPPIPPGQIVPYEGTNFVSLVTTNLSLNLLGVGWLERYKMTNLYNTLSQDLI
jgi:hypothetical protein